MVLTCFNICHMLSLAVNIPNNEKLFTKYSRMNKFSIKKSYLVSVPDVGDLELDDGCSP